MQLFLEIFVYIGVCRRFEANGSTAGRGNVMLAYQKMAEPQFRELITTSILDVLSQLPESHKNIFIWKHYRGLCVEDIASNLKCSSSDVEMALQQVNSALLQKAGALLA
jgi:DNA-directed RNA polymerase specialized sigma24 family protein